MGLYTFIMDYLGGTYISQVKAKNTTIAMHEWIANLSVKEIKGFTEKDKKIIIETDLEDEKPILIDGIKNTWHFLVTTKKGIGYINFIKTKV